MPDYPRFQGFLASRMGAEADPIRVLRKQIYDLGSGLQKPIWVAEHSAAEELRGLSNPEVQGRCLQEVRAATDFICIVNGSYGQPWNDAELCVLELEIIAATLAGCRFHVFKLAPYDSDRRAEYLMRAVETAHPNIVAVQPQPPELILPALRAALTTQQTSTAVPAQFGDKLWLDTTFLDSNFVPLRDSAPDKGLIRNLLEASKAAHDEPTRLIYAWMALRHLCAAPYTDERFSSYLPLWDAALSVWASASAWYGLHGHNHLGRLAAVNTMIGIRRQIAKAGGQNCPLLSIQGTYGALASEYYSMAKLSKSRETRATLMKRALGAVNIALSEKHSDESGLLGIRASILQASGHLCAGVRDYERMLDLRLQRREDQGRIGEAQAELGMGHLRILRIWTAGRLLRNGVKNLERANRKEFLVRALRKLALFYIATLRPGHGLATLERAHEIATDGNMKGQLNQIEGPLRILRRLLPLRRKLRHGC